MATLFFSFGGLFQGKQHTDILISKPTLTQQLTRRAHTVSVLLINAIAVLSEDRFLARSTSRQTRPANPDTLSQNNHKSNKPHHTVGWGNAAQNEPSFGGSQDGASVKAKTINLINSVRTLMRSE